LILVTVGMHNQPFDRLVKAADGFAGLIDEDVIIQRGNSSYLPQTAQHFQWASSQEMDELINKARVVVSHAGAGTIIQCLLARKPLVAVPRLKKFGEHFDNHQTQLVAALVQSNRALSVGILDKDSLALAVQKASHFEQVIASSNELAGSLRSLITQWDR